jgi:hypothetical protein
MEVTSMAAQIVSLIDGGQLYVYKLGRAVRVTAVATSVEDANNYMHLHHTQSVIAVVGEVVLIAEHDDKGKLVKL